MATAKEFRAALISCANDATKRAPADLGWRAQVFVSLLAGSMSFYGERAVQDALWEVLGQPNPYRRPADGA